VGPSGGGRADDRGRLRGKSRTKFVLHFILFSSRDYRD
jgi:hypothetical protein